MGYDLCGKAVAGRRPADDLAYYHANIHWMRLLRAVMAAAGCFPDPDDSDAWRWEDSPCTAACVSADDCDEHCEAYAGFLAAAPLTEKLGSNEGWWVTRSQSARIAESLTTWIAESGQWDARDGTRGELVTPQLHERVAELLGIPGQLSPEAGPGASGTEELEPEDLEHLDHFVAFCRLCGEDSGLDGFEVW